MARPRTHFFDERFFRVIDTEARAYWLGMLAADGCVERGNHCISLALKDEDGEHVASFLRCVGSPQPPRRKVKHGVDGREFVSWSAALYSKAMFEDLAQYNIVPAKSLIAKPVDDSLIPAGLRRHYWRGVVDGDGTLSRRNDHGWSVSLCGTLAMCEGFRSFANDNGARGGCIVRSKNHPHPFYSASFRGSACPFDVANLLYSGATVALPRKAERARLLLSGERKCRWRSWPTRTELDAMMERLGAWPKVAAELKTSAGGLWRIRKSLGYPVGHHVPDRTKPWALCRATPHELGL